jgi:hypothetical protein
LANIVDAGKAHSATISDSQRPVLDCPQNGAESVSLKATDDRGIEITDLGGRRREVRRKGHRERPRCGVEIGDAALKGPITGNGARNGDQHQSRNPDSNRCNRRQKPALAGTRPAEGALDGDAGTTHTMLVALLCRWW